MEEYTSGTDVNVKVTFRPDVSSPPQDPDTVTLKWQIYPGGPVTTWTVADGQISHPIVDSGEYFASLPSDGIPDNDDPPRTLYVGWVQWLGVGGLNVKEEMQFVVRKPEL